MKKLLSLLGSVLIASTSAATVVACSNSNYRPSDAPNYIPGAGKLLSVQQEEKSVEDFSKSIILSYAYGVDNEKMRNYLTANGTDLSTIITNNIDKAFNDDAAQYRIKKATIGNDGGIFEQGVDSFLGSIREWIKQNVILKLPEKIRPTVASILDSLLSTDSFSEMLRAATGKDQDDWAYKLAESMKTMLGAVSNVNVPVAMEGINYALGLIPNISTSNITSSAIETLVSQLLDSVGGTKDTVDGTFNKIKDAVTVKAQTSDELLKDMHDKYIKITTEDRIDTIDKLKGSTLITDVLGFISDASSYLGYFAFEDNPMDKIGSQIPSNNGMFNIAGLLKGLGRFISTDSQKPIEQLMQIMLLNKDKKINDTFGKDFVNLLNLNGINAKGEDLESTLTDNDNDKFKDIFEGNWNQIDAFKSALSKDENGSLYRAFWNDDDWSENEQPNLKSLLNLPIYKLLFLFDNEGIFGSDALSKTGLLPKIGQVFKKNSIVELAGSLGTNVKEIDSYEKLSKRDFDFDNLKKLVDHLLYRISADDGILDGNNKPIEGSILSTVNTIISKQNGINSRSINQISNLLGYTSAVDNNEAISNKFVNRKSIMGEIINTFMKLGGDSQDIKLSDVTANAGNDNLQFLFNVIQPLMGNLLEGVDYSYWMKTALKDSPEDSTHYLWNGDLAKAAQREVGIKNEEFFNNSRNNKRIKTITYSVWLTPESFAKHGGTFINLLPYKPDEKMQGAGLWKITFSRDKIEDNLKIADASLNPPIIS